MTSAWRRGLAPGSVANLGPGFDALAVAVPLRTTVWVRSAERSSVRLLGSGRSERIGPDHLIARALGALGAEPAEIVVASELPLARGLGSSASLLVALGGALGVVDVLGFAAGIEGHPENVAASVVGGAVVAVGADGARPIVRRVPLDPQLRLVLVIPVRTLSTEEARRVLPARYDRGDVVFDLQRACAVVASLARIEDLEPELFRDRLHEPWRTPLFPESEAVRARLLEAGCRGATWSGAGSTMVGLVEVGKAQRAADAVQEALAELGITAGVRVVAPDLEGLVVDDEEPPSAALAEVGQPVPPPGVG